jgi:hypothetical protein
MVSKFKLKRGAAYKMDYSIEIQKKYLWIIRDLLPTIPMTKNRNPSDLQGYTRDELKLIDTVCDKLDVELGEYGEVRRDYTIKSSREARKARLLDDKKKCQEEQQRLLDEGQEFIEELDLRLGNDSVIVYLEVKLFDFLKSNWTSRDLWNAVDEVRVNIKTIDKVFENAKKWEIDKSDDSKEPILKLVK